MVFPFFPRLRRHPPCRRIRKFSPINKREEKIRQLTGDRHRQHKQDDISLSLVGEFSSPDLQTGDSNQDRIFRGPAVDEDQIECQANTADTGQHHDKVEKIPRSGRCWLCVDLFSGHGTTAKRSRRPSGHPQFLTLLSSSFLRGNTPTDQE